MIYSKFLRLVIGIFLLSGQVSAKEYFVSVNGSDNNDGSFTTPFKSIAKASEVAIAGDTITINQGVYILEKTFSPLHSGQPDKWILYRGKPGKEIVFDGQNIYYDEYDGEKTFFSNLTKGIFQIENVNYIRFENIKIINSRAAGFIVRGPETKQIELVGCRTDRTYNSGIGLWYADSVCVRHCEVVRANDPDFRNQEVPKPGEAPHEAISICGACFFDVSYNHVYNCYKEGIDCKEVSRHGIIHHNLVHDLPRQAYYTDAWFGLLEDVEFHHNIGYNCGWGFAISVEGKGSELRNIRFHHNILYNMKGAGILFGAWGEDRLRSDIHIYNNTIYKCGTPQWFSGGVGSIDILSKNFKDVYVYRNICDKGWDYEIGFSFPPEKIEAELKNRNFIAAENLIEGIKNRPSRMGQFDLYVTEFLPEKNKIGAPLYRNELEYDLVPEELPIVKQENIVWKYEPSPWYGALKPLKTIE